MKRTEQTVPLEVRGDCAAEIPPRTVNFDHIPDEEKLALWAIHRGSPAGIRQRLIDLQGVGL
ncbi:hypothetical protein Lepto7375DRAFT_0621 [Leptolyngbya sp. PCC 7375]|nr:hypothetical protein Lepto7375DRAFT_0621 [Leptolyngbya sp. PCC 7375]